MLTSSIDNFGTQKYRLVLSQVEIIYGDFNVEINEVANILPYRSAIIGAKSNGMEI